MNRLYLSLLRYSNFCHLKIACFVLFFLIICGYENIAFCEAPIPFSVGEGAFNAMKEDAYLNIKNVINNPEFINHYGRSRLKPQFVTWYYTYIICSEEYSQEFIRSLPLKEIWHNHRDNADYIQLYITGLFIKYTQQKLQFFENMFYFLPHLFVITKTIMTQMHFNELIINFQHFFDSHPEATENITVVSEHYFRAFEKFFAYVIDVEHQLLQLKSSGHIEFILNKWGSLVIDDKANNNVVTDITAEILRNTNNNDTPLDNAK